jgi:flavin reductase (DIM6/NTAB) family NADH-FMN oxidoreductase RutF
MNINSARIAEMEKRYRTTFINSLPGYKCLQMVGTTSKNGNTNLGLFNSIFHIGANPPLLGMIFRPESNDHDTLNNIKETGAYTLNNVLPEWYDNAHQTSARFPSGTSEFKECGFSAYFVPSFAAPFVQESTIKIGMLLTEVIDLRINDTTLVIGEISQVIIDESILEQDGYVDHIKAGTVTVTGLDSYFTAELIERLAYAKPDDEQPWAAKDSDS